MSGKHRQPGEWRRFSWIVAPAFFILLAVAAGVEPRADADDAASTVAAPTTGETRPKGRLNLNEAEETPGANGIDIHTAWSLPPDGAPRGTNTPIYDNGQPLDDGGDPASQASLQADGAVPLWRFIAAAADNFELPVSPVNPGANYHITTVRVAFDFAGSGSATAAPLSTWLHGVYVTIYANSPLNQPGGAPALVSGDVTFTGNVIDSVLVPVGILSNQQVVNTGCRTVHTIDIPVDFTLASQTTYWLSVMPRFAAPPQSFWCLSSGTTGNALPGHRGSNFDVQFWTVVEGNSGSPVCSAEEPAGTAKELSFQLFGDALQSSVGACCNTLTGNCVDVDRTLNPTACMNPDEVFHGGQLCDFLFPACDEGACCFTDQFNVDQCVVTTISNCNTTLNGHAFHLGEECNPNIDCTRPPINDDCFQAPQLAGNNILQSFNTANATTNPATPAPPGCGNIVRDIWYNYSAACTGTVVITTVGSSFDTVLAVYSAAPDTFCPPCVDDNAFYLDCNDDADFEPGSTYSLIVVPNVTAGQCLKIRVGGKAGGNPQGGPGTLRIFCVPAGQGACCNPVSGACSLEFEVNCPPPGRWFAGEPCGPPAPCLPNDTCLSPQALPGNKHVDWPFDTTRATATSQVQNTACGLIEQDIWFAYTAPCTGEIEISTHGSTYDTFLVAYDFTGGAACPDPALCNELASRTLACNDDVGGDPLARLRLTDITAGDCIIIRVGGHDNGFATSGGPGILHVTCIAPNEGACCFDDGSPCDVVDAAACVAPNLFLPGVVCEPGICPVHPENDLCENAIVLSGPGPVTVDFNTILATTDEDAPLTRCGSIVQDIWYQYTVPCSGTLIVSTVGSAYDTRLAIYGQPNACPTLCPQPAPDGNFSELACNDDIESGVTVSRAILLATIGDCILIRVGGNDLGAGQSGGAGQLHIECNPEILGACCRVDRICNDIVPSAQCGSEGEHYFPGETCNLTNCPPFPPNDECAGAFALSDGAWPFDTTPASSSLPMLTPTLTCANPDLDLWYTYQATCTGLVVVSTCTAANFDTVIAVYPDCTCPPASPPLVCDNDACGDLGGASEAFFQALAGQCYLIRIGGVNGASGSGSITLSCDDSVPLCCVGDTSGNGIVDTDDIAAFADALTVDPPPAIDDPIFCRADMNVDGVLDGRDLDLFVVALIDGLPCQPLVSGACCHGDGGCSIGSQEDCANSGGDYQGNNTHCSPETCPPPVGACCEAASVCTFRTSQDCASVNGAFLGNGSLCDLNVCSMPGVECDVEEIVELEANDAMQDDLFGTWVSLDGDVMAVSATNVAPSGAIYVLRRTNGAWGDQVKLLSPDSLANSGFGTCADIDGERLIVGATSAHVEVSPGVFVPVGAVFHFEFDGVNWQPQATLSPPTIASGQSFGSSVALQGDTALIGAQNDDDHQSNAGAVYAFAYNGIAWVQQQKFFGSDIDTQDNFGNAVALDGDLAVIGAHRGDGVGSGHGAVYVFTRTAGTWSQTKKLVGSNLPPASGRFGFSVSISGSTIAVSAPDANSMQGFVYLFEQQGIDWIETARLQASDPEPLKRFGFSLRLQGETLAVGCPDKNAVYLFVRQGGVWAERQKITSPGATVADALGLSVDLDGSTIVAGATLGEVTGTNTGTAFVFDFECDGACCLGNVCDTLLPSQCAAQGGLFLGAGVVCDVGSCGAPACCAGDFSGNSVADLADVDAFVDAVMNPPLTDPDLCHGDADGSGVVDGSDIQSFVEAVLAGQACPP